jgi:parvulin-like peptidyl-prolyl isomerase
MTVRSERRARHTGLWLFVALLLAAGNARGQQTDEIGLRLIVVRTEAEALDLRARAIAGEAFEVLAAAFPRTPAEPPEDFSGRFRGPT